jgi:hypothetical protein
VKGYTEIPCPELNVPSIQRRAYAKGECRVIISREIHRDHTLHWHLSISCPNRNPTWEEIKDARYSLLPDEAMMAMFLPPKREFVNIHEFCFHLYEIIE